MGLLWFLGWCFAVCEVLFISVLVLVVITRVVYLWGAWLVLLPVWIRRLVALLSCGFV